MALNTGYAMDLIKGGSHSYEGFEDFDSSSYQARFLDNLPITSDSLVLDIATGPGLEADYIENRYHCKVLRSDLSPSALELHPKSPYRVVSQGDELPFKSSRLDLIHIKDALLHFPDLAKFISEVHRVLKIGGELIITSKLSPDTSAPIVAYTNIYFSRDGKPFTKVERFNTMQEYLRFLDDENKYKEFEPDHMGMTIPYFKIDVNDLIVLATEFGFQEELNETWEPLEGEKNWNLGKRFVIKLKKIR